MCRSLFCTSQYINILTPLLVLFQYVYNIFVPKGNTVKTNEIRRGRPRSYDPGEALERATDAFWRQGYSATSLDALSEATRMTQPSLYGACGDKHALYAAALERYIAEGRSQMEAALDDELPLRDALMRVYDG